MAPPVSLEPRECIVAWHYKLHLSISNIVRLSNRCDKTVCNVLKIYQDYDAFTCPFTQPQGRKCLLDRDNLNYLEAVLCAEPGLFNCIAITHKSISKEAAEWNEHLRATWQIAMAQYNPQQLIFVDEAGVDDQTNLHRYGWAPLGQACVHCTSFLRGWKYSILPALSVNGIVALDIFEGSVNQEHF
jgi:hypothetical protein